MRRIPLLAVLLGTCLVLVAGGVALALATAPRDSAGQRLPVPAITIEPGTPAASPAPDATPGRTPSGPQTVAPEDPDDLDDDDDDPDDDDQDDDDGDDGRGDDGSGD